MKILPTLKEDIDLIVKMENDLDNKDFIFQYSKNQHQEIINNKNTFHFKVLDNKNQILGFIILAKEEKNKSLEFRRIVIQKKRNGYGRKVVQWIKHFCFQDLQFNVLWLNVFSDNQRAFNLYQSEDFIQVESKHEYLKTKDGSRKLLYMQINNEI